MRLCALASAHDIGLALAQTLAFSHIANQLRGARSEHSCYPSCLHTLFCVCDVVHTSFSALRQRWRWQLGVRSAACRLFGRAVRVRWLGSVCNVGAPARMATWLGCILHTARRQPAVAHRNMNVRPLRELAAVFCVRRCFFAPAAAPAQKHERTNRCRKQQHSRHGATDSRPHAATAAIITVRRACLSEAFKAFRIVCGIACHGRLGRRCHRGSRGRLRGRRRRRWAVGSQVASWQVARFLIWRGGRPSS